MKKTKILVTFVEAGQGHIVTAEAICESLEKKYGEKIEVIRDYIYKDSNDKSLIKHEKYLIEEVKKANRRKGYLDMQFAFMKTLTEQGTLHFVYSNVFNKVKDKIIKHYEEINPDIIIHTHFEPIHFSCEAKSKNPNNKWIDITYDPDHCVHGWWDNRSDIFITNNSVATKEAVKKKGFSHSQIKQVNFLTRANVVNANESKEFYREKFGIPKDKFAVVLADGAYASANLSEFVKELIKTKKEITIVPICGRNEELYQIYLALKEMVPSNITFMPMPFISNAPELYSACDLFITKAGPNAVLDSVFMHTPIMINFYSGQIEKATNNLFTKSFNMGVYIKNKKKAFEFVEECIDDPEKLKEFRENTYKLNKFNNGADEVADIVNSVIENPEKFRYSKKQVKREKAIIKKKTKKTKKKQQKRKKQIKKRAVSIKNAKKDI